MSYSNSNSFLFLLLLFWLIFGLLFWLSVFGYYCTRRVFVQYANIPQPSSPLTANIPPAVTSPDANIPPAFIFPLPRHSLSHHYPDADILPAIICPKPTFPTHHLPRRRHISNTTFPDADIPQPSPLSPLLPPHRSPIIPLTP
jgi:hypothetical protein